MKDLIARKKHIFIMAKRDPTFLIGTLVGMGGGVMGSFMVATFFRFYDNPTISNFIIYIFNAIIFFGIMFWTLRVIQRNLPQRKKK